MATDPNQLRIEIGEPLPEAREILILVAGDFCPQGKPEKILLDGELFGPGIPELTAAHDLNVVNLECTLTRAETRIKKIGPNLKAAPECARAIRSGGFQVAALANNHMLDFGEQGLLDTVSNCHIAGLKTVGAGKNLEEANQALYLDVNGLRCAILAVAGHEFSIASAHRTGVSPLDAIQNFYQLQEARDQADFVLLIVHAGNDFYPLPSPSLVETCRFFARSGANAIVCSHSHVPGGIEIFQDVPIVYGTGNFLFHWDEPYPPAWYQGILVSLKVRVKKAAGIELIPYVQCRERMLIDLMDGAELEEFTREIYVRNAIITNPEKLNAAWQEYCDQNQSRYLAQMLSLSRFDARLYGRNIVPLRLYKDRVRLLYDMVNYEGHREAILSIFDKINEL